MITVKKGLFVDGFAGGGGASMGIENATGQPIDIAINHDESAIMMHKINHPYTAHYREDIWMIDPITVTGGHPVRLAWFSPDCKHFSRAKGAALVDRKIRGLAWVVLRWAGTVHPDVIMLENVPEFVTWGPVRKGKPIKSKSGRTFKRWYKQLSDLGYTIEYRELCAADYGAPTIRTRFCLIARRDGKPIVWPERTHAPAGSEEVTSGKLKPWRAAAEIIDFSLPTYSIFDSKESIRWLYGARVQRPLKPNTLRRVARGVDKFVIKSADPFLVDCNHSGDGHLYTIKEPHKTITAKHTEGIVEPVFAPYVMSNNANNAPHGVSEPVPTVTTGNRNFLVSASLIQYHTEQNAGEVRGQGLRKPLQTVDASPRYALATAHLTEYFGNAKDGISLKDPMHTVTARDREGLTVAYMQKYYSGVDGSSMTEPLPTVTAIDHNALTCAHLAHFKGGDKGQDLRDPLMTITQADGQFAEVRTTVVKYDGQQDLQHWTDVKALLNRFCGYHLADDEILLLWIRGAWYFISDIGLRMLTPRELYNAMGFPRDYIIDRDIDGRKISRADQVARCGNAVCPAVAEAMVRANLPECPDHRFETLNELHQSMSA